MNTNLSIVQLSESVMSQPSSTSRTVFVRFLPPSANIRRHHLEDLFSQIGPIKKSSVIVPHSNKASGGEKKTTSSDPERGESLTHDSSSYGFVKYLAEEDAQKAAEKFNRTMLRVSAEETIQLRVERASDVANSNKNKHKTDRAPHEDGGDDNEISHKKTSRLILRNLSFYAKESHIRNALQTFGPIEEIHLPTVSEKQGSSKGKSFHRGFGFITFVNVKDAQKCLHAKEIEIYKRKVEVAKALHKAGYEKIKHANDDDKGHNKKHSTSKKDDEISVEQEKAESSSDNDSSSSSNSGDEDEDDDDDVSDRDGHTSSPASASESEEEDDEAEEDLNNEKGGEDATRDATAVGEKRSLFLRNLPFDATRHDIFEAFRNYGRISGIYIVKDKQSGMPRGTAFLSFESQAATQRAIKASGTQSFASQREVTEGRDVASSVAETVSSADGGITLRGRRVFVNLAVDKDTASTLTLDKQSDRGKTVGKDRRNLYLKGEGRVDNEGENALWDQLPEQDKLKRQKAWSDKNTKLRSPLFFISPTRLSIRNLAKDIDERSMKKLCVSAVQRGLKKNVVTAEDQIALWRAAGEMTSREILEKIDSLEDKDYVVPEFDDMNVRKFMPSVVIERDFSSNKKDGAPSRGFGFVEFLHHTHALACLRELNNNTAYSEEYVSGGRQAMSLKGRKPKKKKRKTGDESEVKVPRLIVEFSVENRAKAKKQAEHKAQQRANTIKQKLEHKEKTGDAEKKREKKKSRGQRQRERKRKEKEGDLTETSRENDTNPAKKAKLSKDSQENETNRKKDGAPPKTTKPSKKRKVDKEEENFSKLVDSYQGSLSTTSKAADRSQRPRKEAEKRWYED